MLYILTSVWVLHTQSAGQNLHFQHFFVIKSWKNATKVVSTVVSGTFGYCCFAYYFLGIALLKYFGHCPSRILWALPSLLIGHSPHLLAIACYACNLLGMALTLKTDVNKKICLKRWKNLWKRPKTIEAQAPKSWSKYTTPIGEITTKVAHGLPLFPSITMSDCLLTIVLQFFNWVHATSKTG